MHSETRNAAPGSPMPVCQHIREKVPPKHRGLLRTGPELICKGPHIQLMKQLRQWQAGMRAHGHRRLMPVYHTVWKERPALYAVPSMGFAGAIHMGQPVSTAGMLPPAKPWARALCKGPLSTQPLHSRALLTALPLACETDCCAYSHRCKPTNSHYCSSFLPPHYSCITCQERSLGQEHVLNENTKAQRRGRSCPHKACGETQGPSSPGLVPE